MARFKQALWRAYADWKTLLLGAVLTIIPIVNFASIGFAIECARKPYEKRLPNWKDFKDYWLDGLLVSVIMVIYLLPATAIFSIGYLTDEYDIPILIVSGALSILGYYFLPIAWLRYSRTRFKEAFALKRVAKTCFQSKYFASWIAAIFLSTIIGIIMNIVVILLAITVIGSYFATGFMLFWLLVFNFSIYGQLYEELR